MINKVFRSEADLHNLSLKRTLPVAKGENLDYKKKVVNKPWGYEYLMFENEHVAIWVLHLKNNFATSMHCHPNKKTSLSVLSGKVVSSTLDTKFPLEKGGALLIDKGVFHSTVGASEEGAFIMEIETPPDKNDLVRLKDSYGRENKAYEGENFISDSTSEYEYFDFHDCKLEEEPKHSRLLRDASCTIVRDSVANICSYRLPENANYCFLDGHTEEWREFSLPGVGDLFTYAELKKIAAYSVDEVREILIIE